MLPGPDALSTVHQVRATLRDVRPPVWRRLLVPSDFTLGELHETLQLAFDWDGDHLHVFDVGGTQYGPPEMLDGGTFGQPIRPEDSTTVAAVAARPGAVLTYTYDLGDDWQHRIEVEDIVSAEPDQVYPICRDGRGLAPEEDTGSTRHGQFDKTALTELNELLVDDAFGREGDEMVFGPPSDPVFSDALLDFAFPTSELCDCGVDHELEDDLLLRPYYPVGDTTLAEFARGCDLVQQALGLARWVGEDRALTADLLLRPAEAHQVASALGLTEADLEPGTTLRSANDVPELPALWSAALNADLLAITGTRVGPGAGMHVWAEDGDAADQIDSWARLLAGHLRGRVEHPTGWQPAHLSQLIGTSAQLFYSLATAPVPAGMPALGLLSETDLDPIEVLATMPDIVSGFESATQDWIRAGVLTILPETSEEPLSAAITSAKAVMANLLSEVSMDDDPAGPAMKPLVNAVLESPIVQLTPLGSYGLRRLLMAQGWNVPQIGDYANVPASEILDQLRGYAAFEDAVNEARVWLTARGDEWSAALADVLESARLDATKLGAQRRIALQALLQAAGPRVEPTLDSLADDPWLSAVAALARYELDLGPELTLAQELWLAVDTLTFDHTTDVDDVIEGLEETEVIDLLQQPGAVAAAASLTHPAAAQTLLLAAEVSGNRRLVSQLRRAFDIKPIPPAAKSRSKKKPSRKR